MAEPPRYEDVKDVHTTSLISVYAEPPAYDVITQYTVEQSEHSRNTFEQTRNVETEICIENGTRVENDTGEDSDISVENGIFEETDAENVTDTRGTERNSCSNVHSVNAAHTDHETCSENETSSENESTQSADDCVDSPGNCQTPEITPNVIIRKHSLDNQHVCFVKNEDFNRLSDSQIYGMRSRSASPRHYEKHKSYSPDIRHARRIIRSRSPNRKQRTLVQHCDTRRDIEARDLTYQNDPHGAMNKESSCTSTPHNSMNNNIKLQTPLNSEPRTSATTDIQLNTTRKFSVTKVDYHKPVETKVNLHANHTTSNGKLHLNNKHLKLNISEKCDTKLKTSNGDVICNVTPAKKDIIKADGIILKFKGDYLDSDMLYEWTLEKKNKYAAQIRNVEKTIESAPSKPRDYVLLSCMVLVCCNLPFGIIALYLSLGINTKYEDGKYDAAKKYSKVSLILAILGIVVTSLIVITCLIVFWPNIDHSNES